MMQKKLLFIDRDGTLIREPADYQVDKLEKIALMPQVIPSLLTLKQNGYQFVMITNQDGLGTASFPSDDFTMAHEFMLNLFASQGITFEAIRICPHVATDGCACRKPKIGLVQDYLTSQVIDREHSYVIGDRATDMEFSEQLGIPGLQIETDNDDAWCLITKKILDQDRLAIVNRKTNETCIFAKINLDAQDEIVIDTGLAFFNHMLEQLVKHSGMGLTLQVKGDIEIDDHHTVEDTAIVLGQAIQKALNNKWGINRYGFVLPMDDALTEVALDISGRGRLMFDGQFSREKVGDLSTELVPHFFSSLAESLKATLHIKVTGENNHHMIESIFKCVGRVLRQAVMKTAVGLPSTKGLL